MVIGADATVLGAITIGSNAKVGAGSVVVKSVPANCTVVGVPGRVVIDSGRRLDPMEQLEHGHLPDPEVQAIKCLLDRVNKLEEKLEEMAGVPQGDRPKAKIAAKKDQARK